MHNPETDVILSLVTNVHVQCDTTYLCSVAWSRSIIMQSIVLTTIEGNANLKPVFMSTVFTHAYTYMCILTSLRV